MTLFRRFHKRIFGFISVPTVTVMLVQQENIKLKVIIIRDYNVTVTLLLNSRFFSKPRIIAIKDFLVLSFENMTVLAN